MTVVFGETMDGSHMAIDQFSLKSNAVTLNSPYTADKDQLKHYVILYESSFNYTKILAIESHEERSS